ncbi:hypothetical protein F5888DRAFT_1808803 [Russula emetica]|nr:hypothetical protein F5888DRAFT_1808803 [Russula emetica]
MCSDELADGATLHWIGRRREERALLFSACYRTRTPVPEAAAPENLPPSSICLTEACPHPASSSEATRQADILPLHAWQIFADTIRQVIVPAALHHHLEPGIAPRG